MLLYIVVALSKQSVTDSLLPRSNPESSQSSRIKTEWSISTSEDQKDVTKPSVNILKSTPQASLWGSVKRYDPSKSNAKEFEGERHEKEDGVNIGESETNVHGSDEKESGRHRTHADRDEVTIVPVPGRFSKVSSDVKSAFGYTKKQNTKGGVDEVTEAGSSFKFSFIGDGNEGPRDSGSEFKFSFIPEVQRDVDNSADLGSSSFEELLQEGERLLDGEIFVERVHHDGTYKPVDVQVNALDLTRGLNTKDEVLNVLCSVGSTFCNLDPDQAQKWSDQRKLLTFDFKAKHKETVRKIKQYGKAGKGHT